VVRVYRSLVGYVNDDVKVQSEPDTELDFDVVFGEQYPKLVAIGVALTGTAEVWIETGILDMTAQAGFRFYWQFTDRSALISVAAEHWERLGVWGTTEPDPALRAMRTAADQGFRCNVHRRLERAVKGSPRVQQRCE
jgi:hypothetical protein